ncbi:unnamed protein product [Caenorhabditis angaria]|uniref:Uncharacterized protein n=1 Tax=Caenorhabditis angaria TaxID=860376 RepID=A0A9P1MX87_9PELO|nr:unnamed protein product [Caenorhabditis angaria]
MGKPKPKPRKQPNDEKPKTILDKIKNNKLKFSLLLILIILPCLFLPISIYFTVKDSDVQFVESDMQKTAKDVDQRLKKIQNTVPDKIDELEVLYLQQSRGFFEKYREKLGVKQLKSINAIEDGEVQNIFDKINSADVKKCDDIAKNMDEKTFKDIFSNSKKSTDSLKRYVTLGSAKTNWDLIADKENEKYGILTRKVITEHLKTIKDILKLFLEYAKEKVRNPDVEKYDKQRDQWKNTKIWNHTSLFVFSIVGAILYWSLVVTRCLFVSDKISKNLYKISSYIQLASAIVFLIILLIFTILSFTSTGSFEYSCNISADFDSGNTSSIWYTFNREKISERKITSVCESSNNKVLDELGMMTNEKTVISNLDKYQATIENLMTIITNPAFEKLSETFGKNLNKMKDVNERMKKIESGTCASKIIIEQLKYSRGPLKNLITESDEIWKIANEIVVKWKGEAPNMKADLKENGEKLKKLSLSLSASLNEILEKSDISCSNFNGNADEFCGITVQKTSMTYPITYLSLAVVFIIFIIICILLMLDLSEKKSAKKDEKPKKKGKKKKNRRLRYKDHTGKLCYYLVTEELKKKHETNKADSKAEEAKTNLAIEKMVAEPNIKFKNEYQLADIEKMFGKISRNEEPEELVVLDKVTYEPSMNEMFNCDYEHDEIEETSNRSVSRTSNYSTSTTKTKTCTTEQ